MTLLPRPRPGRAAAEEYVERHLAHLACDVVRGSQSFTGGQESADAALDAFDVTGYARRRNEVLPESNRGASRLSPYIRHGLLSLRDVWDHVAGPSPTGSAGDRSSDAAPGLCDSCECRHDCPIEDWPANPVLAPVDRVGLLGRDPSPDETAGPAEVARGGRPTTVWLTAEWLGRRDPALAAHRRLPVLFVFDEPLLGSLRLSAKRLTFLTETLAELAVEHALEVSLGEPVDLSSGDASLNIV